MTNVIEFPGETVEVAACPVCDGVHWLLLRDGEVICAECDLVPGLQWFDPDDLKDAS